MSKGNLLYGLYPRGQYIHAGLIGLAGGYTDDQIGYLPDRYDMIAYIRDFFQRRRGQCAKVVKIRDSRNWLRKSGFCF